MHKILLIDDDISLGELLCDYLKQNHYEVSVAHSPDNGLNILKKTDFSLLLLDVMMPVMDGFEVLRQLRQFSNIPVIMLTARGDDYDKILGLELGADDYLPKPFNHRELLARIKALLRRLDAPMGFGKGLKFNLHGIDMDEASRTVQVEGQDILLTGTEFLILLYLMRQTGKLISKEELSEHILGRKLAPFDRSLDMHMSNIRKKLAHYGVNDVIKTVRGNGYMMIAE